MWIFIFIYFHLNTFQHWFLGMIFSVIDGLVNPQAALWFQTKFVFHGDKTV